MIYVKPYYYDFHYKSERVDHLETLEKFFRRARRVYDYPQRFLDPNGERENICFDDLVKNIAEESKKCDFFTIYRIDKHIFVKPFSGPMHDYDSYEDYLKAVTFTKEDN